MTGARSTEDASAVINESRRSYSQACPVAHSLDLLGERWTLLIVRDLMFGPLRFSDLRDGLDGLAPNLLSARLSMLRERGIIESVEHITPGSRSAYQLTERGRELAPVIHALARFGVEEWTDPDTDPPPPRLLGGALLALMEPEALDGSSWRATVVLETPGAPSDNTGSHGTSGSSTGPSAAGSRNIEISVRSATAGLHPLNRLRLTCDADGPEPPVLRTTLGTLWDLRRGRGSVSEAAAANRFAYDGPAPVFARMRALFGWDTAEDA